MSEAVTTEALRIAAARRRTRLSRIAVLVGLGLLLAGCGRSHPVPVASQAVKPPAIVAEVEVEPPPAPAAQVREAQGALAELGYDPGPADGVEGPRTEAAVRAFQESADLTVDGRVSEALLAALEPALETHRITQVQRRVAALGYDPGVVDGKLGKHTRMAIKRFEADAGVEPKGKITPALFDLLAKAEASQVQWMADDAGDPDSGAGQLEQALSPAAGPGATNAPNASDAQGVGAGPEAGPEAGQATPLAARIEVAAVRGPEDASEESEPGKRLILPGDTVRLRIGTDQVEVKEFKVGLDGTLALPDDVTLQAAGLTAKQLEDLIMVKLVEVYLMGLKVDVMQPSGGAEKSANETKAAEGKLPDDKLPDDKPIDDKPMDDKPVEGEAAE